MLLALLGVLPSVLLGVLSVLLGVATDRSTAEVWGHEYAGWWGSRRGVEGVWGEGGGGCGWAAGVAAWGEQEEDEAAASRER